MTIRDELHGLVDRLADDHAKEALEVLRHLLHEEGHTNENAATGGAEQMTASAVSSRGGLRFTLSST